MEKNTMEVHQWLEKCYSDSVSSKKMIRRWYADFKCGRTDANNDKHSDRSNEAVTLESIKPCIHERATYTLCRLRVARIWRTVN